MKQPRKQVPQLQNRGAAGSVCLPNPRSGGRGVGSAEAATLEPDRDVAARDAGAVGTADGKRPVTTRSKRSPQGSRNPDLLAHFESRARGFAALYSDGSPTSHFHSTRLALVCDWLDRCGADTVLDAGCGPAVAAEPLARRRVDYFGIDFSLAMVSAARERIGNLDGCHLLTGTVEQLPFRDSSFDAVCCLGVLEYIEDEDLAIQEVNRVLKPEGTVILSMLNGISPYRRSKKAWHVRHGKPRVEKDFTEPHCRALLRTNGLEIADLLYFDFNLIPSPLDLRFPHASVWLSQRLEFLGRGFLRRLGSAFLVKARKSH